MRRGVDEIWKYTQDPAIHQRWDLRFSTIAYLPRASEAEPQRFLYETRIGFGVRISGEGESTGTRENDSGVRTSALRFWSADPKSLIEEGSGYWKYIPAEGGATFLTWYDYRNRFGAGGRLVDRFAFRPFIGWATAWSFDRLRLWMDQGVPPEASLRFAVIHTLCRVAISFTWLWQGLVPKLLAKHPDERALLAASGLSPDWVTALGTMEVLIATAGVAFWRWRAYFVLNVIAMLAALGSVLMTAPEYAVAAFNPVTLNAGVIALAVVGYVASGLSPSASRCRRAPEGRR